MISHKCHPLPPHTRRAMDTWILCTTRTELVRDQTAQVWCISQGRTVFTAVILAVYWNSPLPLFFPLSWVTVSRTGSPTSYKQISLSAAEHPESKKLLIDWENLHHSSDSCYFWPKGIWVRTYWVIFCCNFRKVDGFLKRGFVSKLSPRCISFLELVLHTHAQ